MSDKPSILDARIRPPYREFLDTVNYDPRLAKSPTRLGTTPPRSLTERSMDLFIDEMDEAGIDRALVMGRRAARAFGLIPNESLRGILDEYPGRFWVFGGVGEATTRDRVDEARRCIEEHGFPGIAVDPGWMDVPLMADAPELFPLYAYCEQAQIPVAITMSVLVGPEIEHSHPRSVHNIAAAFPDLTIVVVHSAWPWVMEVLGVAFRHPNVWVLPDFYLNIPQMPGFELFLDAARSYLGDRLLYASSYPSRPLGQSADEFRRLGLDDPLRERCMVSNLNRLLGVGVTA